MRRFYPGTRSLTASILLLLLPVFASAANNTPEQMVAEGVSTTYLEQNLQARRTEWLKHMLDSPEDRLEYVKSLYANQMLEQAIVESGLNQNRSLLTALDNARNKVLLDALIGFEFEQINEDLEALALERYTAQPDLYVVRKRIKIALILVEKHEGMEDQAKMEIEEIAAQLNEQPENVKLFYELATKHSDDKMAYQGGVNKKWLIEPLDLEQRLPILQAAFALETPGQMTEIVESEQGFTIVRLLGVTPARQLSFEASKPEIISHIMAQLKNSKRAEVMKSLQADDDLPVNDEIVREMISATYATRTSEAPGS